MAEDLSDAEGRARAREAPRQRGPKATLSRTLMCGKIPGAWDSRATSRRPAGTKTPGPSRTRSPRITRPASASSSPAATAQAVDLPEPLGPTSARVRPASTVRSTTTSRAVEAKAMRRGAGPSCRGGAGGPEPPAPPSAPVSAVAVAAPGVGASPGVLDVGASPAAPGVGAALGVPDVVGAEAAGETAVEGAGPADSSSGAAGRRRALRAVRASPH